MSVASLPKANSLVSVQKTVEKGTKRRNLTSNGEYQATTAKKPRLVDVKKGEEAPSSIPAFQPDNSGPKQATSTPPARRKATPMDEVMKLHQDEGVLHLLHALPTSRRKEKVNYFPSKQQQAGGGGSSVLGADSKRRASLLSSMSSNHRSLSATSPSGGRSSPLLALANQIAAEVSASSNAGFSSHPKPKKNDTKKNNLIRLKGAVPPMKQDDLLTPRVMDVLKKLPKEEYLHLWSSTTRYKLAEEALSLATNSGSEEGKQSSVSPGKKSTHCICRTD